MKEKIFVNVASSTYVLEGFVNLENSIYISMGLIFRLFRFFIPTKYLAESDKFLEAKKIAPLQNHNCLKPLPFEKHSVDHILCSHFLEHVYPNEVDIILKDYLRVLKPSGTLHVILPDIEYQVQQYLKNKQEGNLSAADEFIFNTFLSKESSIKTIKMKLLDLTSKSSGLSHHWMYDKESMSQILINANFTILPINNTPSKLFRKENDVSLHLVCQANTT